MHSTELAAVELVDRIRLYIDKGQIPLSVFLINPILFHYPLVELILIIFVLQNALVPVTEFLYSKYQTKKA